MFAAVGGSRPAARPRVRRGAGPRSEALESRRLLAASPSVFPDLSFAIGTPVPSLVTGTDLAAISTAPISLSPFPTFGEPVIGLEPGNASFSGPDQMPMAFEASVSLPLITTVFPPLNGPAAPRFSAGPTVTGPSTTLNPLGPVTETAVAAASEVTRPTPGFTDLVSSYISPQRIVPLPHLRGPNREPPPDRGSRPVPPGPPSFRPPVEAAPAAPRPTPVEPKAVEPAPQVPARPADVAPPAVPEAVPTTPKQPEALRAWDAAIELVEASLADDSSALATDRAVESMAVGALMAAWGGWNLAARLEGRFRSRPLAPSLPALEAGPGGGDDRRARG